METFLYHISSNSGILNNGTRKSNMTFYLPKFIESDDNTKNIYIGISKAELPQSWYLINDYNNTLTIQTTTGTMTYTLTKGNYNINTFVSALTSLLGSNFSISYSSITNKLTISYISSFTIIASSTTMYRFLGINEYDNISSTNNSIISPYVCNFLPIQRIHIRCAELFVDSFNSYDNSSDIFLSLQNNSSSSLGTIVYNNINNFKYLTNIENLETLTLRFTDDRNRDIDFNNCDWHLTFQVEYEYYVKPEKNTLARFFKLYRQNLANDYFQSLLLQENEK